MRILVDLQALQTEQSRHRGIGRYSLALFNAMARDAQGYEMEALFNGAFPESLVEARRWIADSVPDDRIHVFEAPGRTALVEAGNGWRARAAEALLALKVDAIAPDYVHVASLFEGFIDDAVTTIRPDGRWSATIYDLIPWVQRTRYLENTDVRRSYMTRLGRARQARLLFAISNSARKEAIEALDLDPRSVVDIQGDVDALFSKGPVTSEREAALRRQLGLHRAIVMYTAGIDHRKNIEGLIAAYAALSGELRAKHQLAIVCKAAPAERALLLQVARRCGLQAADVVVTGYVDDADLADLYRLCKLFVFPSLHEGFGMPILEAMRSGAAVIGSNCSSMPEILGNADAQFDPRSVAAMTRALARPLSDPDFLRMLVANSERQQVRFSWRESARRVVEAFRVDHDRRLSETRGFSAPSRSSRPRLAYVSPLPPEQSGIANYSSELIPALARHYDITLVTDLDHIDDYWLEGVHATCSVYQFETRASVFDRILYQLGNSAAFHTTTLRLMRGCPGVVVLHDFFLSNLFDHNDLHGGQPGLLREELFRSHGFAPLLELEAGKRGTDWTVRDSVVRRFPASRVAFDHGYGTIVHSGYALKAAADWYGITGADAICQIDHIRSIPARDTRTAARDALNLAQDAVVVCSFGLIGRTKLNLELVRAWCASPLLHRPGHRLVFLGPIGDSPYDTALRDIVAAHDATDRIEFKGFVDDRTFQRYLEAADGAVQLRTDSRGETSGAVLHCLANGLPVLVNRHGTLAELPAGTTLQIPDRFTDAELAAAVMRLLDDPVGTKQRIDAGLAYIRDHCDAETIAKVYETAIERFYASNTNCRLDRCLTDLVSRPDRRFDMRDLERMACIAAEHAPVTRQRYRFIDIGSAPSRGGVAYDAIVERVRSLLVDTARNDFRAEPVHWDGHTYRFARRWAIDAFGLAPVAAEDDEVDVRHGDELIFAGGMPPANPERENWLEKCRQRGMLIDGFVGSQRAPTAPARIGSGADSSAPTPVDEGIEPTVRSFEVVNDVGAYDATDPTVVSAAPSSRPAP